MNPSGESLYNGIQLPATWPPTDLRVDDTSPMRVPYLEQPPAVIPIDGGRQLFVDDFLVAFTNFTRVHQHPARYTGNPIFMPTTPWEKNGDLPPCTVPKCGGIWYDERERLFKMWYMASYLGAMCYATSTDGLHWERPELDVVPGTNQILPPHLHPDSGTVWLTQDADGDDRYVFMMREPNPPGKGRFPGLMLRSADGIHWSDPIPTGDMDDRSTMFYNPFRRKWVQSIRHWQAPRYRCRRYWEADSFLASGDWATGQPPFWCGADQLDEAGDSAPQLYNLDAVAYESVLIGMHQILKGPPNPIGEAAGLPKLTELTFGSSRDGFHWHRPDRRAFIGAERRRGCWDYGYVESTGGVCVVVGDELWFYYSAYGGDTERTGPKVGSWHTNGTYANGALGLAKLRRDGFCAMRAGQTASLLRTRPLRFSGSRFFVNANTVGADLRVAVLDEAGEPIPGYGAADCLGFCGNSTCAELRWRDQDASLAALAGRPLRLQFECDRGDLYAFWVTDDPAGESGGYHAAGRVR